MLIANVLYIILEALLYLLYHLKNLLTR